MKRRTLIIILLILLVITGAVVAFSITGKKEEANPTASSLSLTGEITDGEYPSFLEENKETPYLSSDIEIRAENFGLDLLSASERFGYTKNAVLFDNGDLDLEVTVNHACLCQIYFDYCSLANSLNENDLSVYVNGKIEYEEASQIVLPTYYTDESEDPTQDRYGNDIAISQTEYRIFTKEPLRDGSRLYDGGNYFLLKEGLNTITVRHLSGSIVLGSVYLKGKDTLISYRDYLLAHEDTATSTYERYEAEKSLYKNDSSILASSSSDLGVLPSDIMRKKLNVIGASSYQNAGESVSWKVTVLKAGYYNLTFKVLQTNRNNSSYRTLYVNNEVPFAEAKHLVFSYDSKWQNIAISGFNNESYKIYLNVGENLISLEVDSTLFTPLRRELSRITSEMNSLGLSVKKITGNNTDKGIDWDMLSYFPDLIERINSWKASLSAMKTYLESISGFTKTSYQTRDFVTVIDYLNRILNDVDELPRKLGLLSEGDSCSAQILATWIDSITYQPLTIDCFYLYSDDQIGAIPKANANFLLKSWTGVRRFFLSFFDKEVNDNAKSDELEIWVNRSRIYVDELQQLSDQSFTTKTGIKVKISLMNDEGKLVLANAANQEPDVALGISAWIPNEFGMRGAIYDLKSFDDLKDVISVYGDEELIPGVYDGHLYSLPETENFYVLYYRKDILSSLGLTVPDTWDDVIGMLPTLTRYGMSFYVPLSSSSSTKSFDSTSSFIFQYGGSLYASDGMHGGIDSEQSLNAIAFMTDLYREYGLTYNVTSFFNEFRYGTIPIGIADFGTYLSLANGAPELSGLYGIHTVPGYTRDGVTYRYQSGAQQSMMIFEKSDKKEEAWEFLKWWSGTEAQVAYSERLVNTYGKEYLWNTANLEAFAMLDWPKDDKDVILSQWSYLKEVPKIPGSYIIEREISNIWNAVVFDDANLRSEVSDASIRINRELKRKLTQFGYYDSLGNKLRDVNIASATLIASWRNEP